jgi:hypothetical protein
MHPDPGSRRRKRIIVGGPLAEFAEGLRRELVGQGYALDTVGDHVHLLADLSDWLLGLYRAKTRCGPCEHRVVGWSGRSVVLVDDAGEDPFAPYGRVEINHDGRVVFGRTLSSALMWTMPIEMPLILGQHGAGWLPL